ncbi:YtfJ family protein [Photobacterium rosenbergii]|uniref:YtfJ family protein n=1 Tax=Photobacterium rosenbergii TaxID=294936 RepID=UPI00130505A5|nr:YtfJ family protein [Photobacterium rosenbergii]
MKTKLFAAAAIAALISGSASAATFGVGDTLPAATVTDGGYAYVEDGKVEYKEWSVSEIKPQGTIVLIAKAGRAAAADMVTTEFVEKLKSANVDMINFINKDDAAFGTGMFVEGAIEESMLKDPAGRVVLDRDGELFAEWELEEQSAAVIIVKDGKVAYLHEGALDASKENKILELSK